MIVRVHGHTFLWLQVCCHRLSHQSARGVHAPEDAVRHRGHLAAVPPVRLADRCLQPADQLPGARPLPRGQRPAPLCHPLPGAAGPPQVPALQADRVVSLLLPAPSRAGGAVQRGGATAVRQHAGASLGVPAPTRRPLHRPPQQSGRGPRPPRRQLDGRGRERAGGGDDPGPQRRGEDAGGQRGGVRRQLLAAPGAPAARRRVRHAAAGHLDLLRAGHGADAPQLRRQPRALLHLLAQVSPALPQVSVLPVFAPPVPGPARSARVLPGLQRGVEEGQHHQDCRHPGLTAGATAAGLPSVRVGSAVVCPSLCVGQQLFPRRSGSCRSCLLSISVGHHLLPVAQCRAAVVSPHFVSCRSCRPSLCVGWQLSPVTVCRAAVVSRHCVSGTNCLPSLCTGHQLSPVTVSRAPVVSRHCVPGISCLPSL